MSLPTGTSGGKKLLKTIKSSLATRNEGSESIKHTTRHPHHEILELRNGGPQDKGKGPALPTHKVGLGTTVIDDAVFEDSDSPTPRRKLVPVRNDLTGETKRVMVPADDNRAQSYLNQAGPSRSEALPQSTSRYPPSVPYSATHSVVPFIVDRPAGAQQSGNVPSSPQQQGVMGPPHTEGGQSDGRRHPPSASRVNQTPAVDVDVHAKVKSMLKSTRLLKGGPSEPTPSDYIPLIRPSTTLGTQSSRDVGGSLGARTPPTDIAFSSGNPVPEEDGAEGYDMQRGGLEAIGLGEGKFGQMGRTQHVIKRKPVPDGEFMRYMASAQALSTTRRQDVDGGKTLQTMPVHGVLQCVDGLEKRERRKTSHISLHLPEYDAENFWSQPFRVDFGESSQQPVNALQGTETSQEGSKMGTSVDEEPTSDLEDSIVDLPVRVKKHRAPSPETMKRYQRHMRRLQAGGFLTEGQYPDGQYPYGQYPNDDAGEFGEEHM